MKNLYNDFHVKVGYFERYIKDLRIEELSDLSYEDLRKAMDYIFMVAYGVAMKEGEEYTNEKIEKEKDDSCKI